MMYRAFQAEAEMNMVFKKVKKEMEEASPEKVNSEGFGTFLFTVLILQQ